MAARTPLRPPPRGSTAGGRTAAARRGRVTTSDRRSATADRTQFPLTGFGPVCRARRGSLDSMCGRYASAASRANLLEQFLVDEQNADELRGPDYNVAPTKQAPVVIARAPKDAPDDEDPVRQLRSFRWGLVPFWAKDLKIGSRLLCTSQIRLAGERPVCSADAVARRLAVGAHNDRIAADGALDEPVRQLRNLIWGLYRTRHPRSDLASSGCLVLRPAAGSCFGAAVERHLLLGSTGAVVRIGPRRR